MSQLDDRPPPPPPPPPQGQPRPAAAPRSRPSLAPPPRRLGRRAPVASSPEGLPTRRRWGRFAAGTTLALLGAWIFAALYVSAGDRVEVLALAHDVGQFKELTEEDFRTVRVSTDPGVNTVKASERDEMIGRKTAIPLLEGSLLAETALVPKDQAIVGPDDRVYPFTLKRGRYPDGEDLGGVVVDIQILPENTAQGEEPETIENAVILRAGEPDPNTQDRVVQVIAPKSADDDLAVKEDRIKLLAHGEGG